MLVFLNLMSLLIFDFVAEVGDKNVISCRS